MGQHGGHLDVPDAISEADRAAKTLNRTIGNTPAGYFYGPPTLRVLSFRGDLFQGTKARAARFMGTSPDLGAGTGEPMGRGILLWLIGVPIPIIILLALFFR
jgi:hypothetical protein